MTDKVIKLNRAPKRRRTRRKTFTCGRTAAACLGAELVGVVAAATAILWRLLTLTDGLSLAPVLLLVDNRW